MLTSPAYQQQHRIGEQPKWVYSEENSHNGHVDTPIGRMMIFPGDWILYDAGWNVVGVVRKSAMESMG